MGGIKFVDGSSVDGRPAFAAWLLPPEPIEWLLESVSFETSVAPALAFVAGLVLTLSPISWPSIPAVMTVLTPAARAGTADGLTPEWGEERQPLSRVRGALVVLGFVIGMDGVIATIGALAVSVTYLLVRGAVALSLLAAVLLAVAGLRLVTRRASLCARTLALPPTRYVPSVPAWCSPWSAVPAALRSLSGSEGPRLRPGVC